VKEQPKTSPRGAIVQTDIIRLSTEGQRQIADAIVRPPAPTKALTKAAKRHRELFGEAG
jgi:uncharacterized protein (DUF1778 family)